MTGVQTCALPIYRDIAKAAAQSNLDFLIVTDHNVSEVSALKSVRDSMVLIQRKMAKKK